MSETVPTVVCVGVATLDTIALVERTPGNDERVVGQRIESAGGGPAATAAVTLARLGVPVGFCGVVGDDDAGRFIRDSLEQEGVDCRWLRRDRDVRTTESVIVVERESGRRSIVTTPSIGPSAQDIPRGDWLHVDQTGYAAVHAQGLAHGVRLSVDDGNRIDDLRLDTVSLYAPTLSVVTARFGGSTRNALEAAHAAGAREVVATDGAEGSYVLTDGGVNHVPAMKTDVVSTLGAGDVFHGALLAAVVSGRGLVDAARFAAEIAAQSCRELDGRSGIPRDRTVEFRGQESPARSVEGGTHK